MNLKNLIRKARGCLMVHAGMCGKGAYILSFSYGKVVVTVWIILNDARSEADVTITNMTTLPYSEIKKGYGKHTIRQVLSWMESEGAQACIASHVEKHNEKFWTDRGFVKVGNETYDFKYTLP